MRLPWLGLTVLSVIVLIVVAWQVSDARTQDMMRRPSWGSITEGSLLGVSVGDDAEQAVAELRDLGFQEVKFHPGGGAQFPDGRMILDPVHREDAVVILPSQTIITLHDRGWRNGTIILTEDGGQVIRITWRYQPFHIDL